MHRRLLISNNAYIVEHTASGGAKETTTDVIWKATDSITGDTLGDMVIVHIGKFPDGRVRGHVAVPESVLWLQATPAM